MRYRIRIGIKEQLGLLVSFAALLGLGILSAVTYSNSYNTILDLRGDRLAVMARLKSSQVSQSVRALINQVYVVAYRDFFGEILYNYYNFLPITEEQKETLSTTIESSDDFVAAFVFDKDLKGIVDRYTTSPANADIIFPYDLLLPGQGNDPTTSNSTILAGVGGALMGPIISSDISQTLLYSLTVVVYGDLKDEDYFTFTAEKPVRAFLTIVCIAENLVKILNDNTGMENSRTELLRVSGSTFGMADPQYGYSSLYVNYTYAVPPPFCTACFGSSYPIDWDFSITKALFNNSSGSEISAFSGEYDSVGYAPVDLYIYRPWCIFVYETHESVYRPLHRLRVILLISVFSIGGGVCVITILLSHWAVAPIRILQAATEKTTKPSSNISEDNYSNKWRYRKNLFWVKSKLQFCFFRTSPAKTTSTEHPGSNTTLVEKESANNSLPWPNSLLLNKLSKGEKETSEEIAPVVFQFGQSFSADNPKECDNLSTPSTDRYNNNEKNKFSDKEHWAIKNNPNEVSIDSKNFIDKNSISKSELCNKSSDKIDKFQDGSISSTPTGFYIPEKVIQKKRFIRDELTELTETFNQMTDELRKQYDTLDQRVKQRTAETETAKTLAETANEAKTLFIANITNELRTPLNSILAMTAVSMTEVNIDKVKADLKVIYKSGELLLHLLTDLLTFSKNQFGKLELDELEFTINDVVSQIEAIFGEQSARFHIDFQINVLSNCLHEVILWGDLNRILQICINILSNAFKFTEVGGAVKVLISIDEIRISSGRAFFALDDHNRLKSNEDHTTSKFRSGDWIDNSNGGLTPANFFNSEGENFDKSRYSISSINPEKSLKAGQSIVLKIDILDTGVGISTELQSKIFEPFACVNDNDELLSENAKHSSVSEKGKSKGTGLGLSICKQLVNLMNGTIGVHSKMGEGSTFSFIFPLKVSRSLLEGSDFYNTAANSSITESIICNSNEDVTSKDDSDFGKPIKLTTTSSPSGPLGLSAQKLNNGNLRHRNSRSSSLAPHLPSLNNVYQSPSSEELKRTSDKLFKSLVNGDSMHNNPIQAFKSESGESLQRKAAVNTCILVVEDNKVNQEVMKRMLNLEGIKNVTIANNGLEAVEKVKLIQESNSHYDIIFMDIQMPVMDGREATKTIREDLNYRHPIIAVSAYADSSNVTDCMAVGMNSFLDKPLRRLQLHEVLDEYGIDAKKKENSKPAKRV
ncbi:hypothetical protein NADFUDRAFT_49203 [Nadsonia fulvescens var. elongata DSM 6958]|uniref:histidine kinase n=1 Tax=Nadsonia fulvescens var. elongata DSM 6958 TaxID=857566 RepID=A0A1E3PT07_9ASCO|nr:hypothetical protein NADFUDRAFT_49203 [Nadsonia fulvescens var. elongata DSM 6958]